MRSNAERALGRGSPWTLALLALVWAAGAGAEGNGQPGAALAARLRAAGRAEVHIERRAPDPLGGAERRASGRLALETPDRARIDFEATREIVTLRSDGGEWLQPALRQMIRFGPESARLGLRWWGVLLGRSGTGHTERALGGGRFLLTLAAAPDAPADSAWVTVGSDGLPRLLEVNESEGGHAIYRLGRWKFAAPRGPGAFALRAPSGYEVVDMR